jgi:hypothetical protein
MMDSLALLLAARAELVTNDDRDLIVTNLCRMFDIAADDALAAVIAAQLLADQPGRNDPFDADREPIACSRVSHRADAVRYSTVR